MSLSYRNRFLNRKHEMFEFMLRKSFKSSVERRGPGAGDGGHDVADKPRHRALRSLGRNLLQVQVRGRWQLCQSDVPQHRPLPRVQPASAPRGPGSAGGVVRSAGAGPGVAVAAARGAVARVAAARHMPAKPAAGHSSVAAMAVAASVVAAVVVQVAFGGGAQQRLTAARGDGRRHYLDH